MHRAATNAAGRGWPGTGPRPNRCDGFSVALTRAADHSLLWIAASILLAAGGRRARRSAARGLAAVAVTSAVTNGPLRPAFRRERPGHGPALAGGARPGSFASPSGHAASAFAFAAAVCWQLPEATPVLAPLAGAVAGSRVSTGGRHRVEVIAGGAIGAAIGLAVSTARRPGRRRAPGRAPLFAEAVLVTSSRVTHSRDFAAAHEAMRGLGLKVTAQLDVGETGRLPVLLADRAPMLVVAAGGDGTAGAVADMLARTHHVLGVLPLGTSNNFARSLGIRVDPRRAVALFAEGKVASIDLGRFVPDQRPPRHFVHAATVGLNARFARVATRGAVRDRLGRFTYLLAAAYAMRDHSAFECELRYDDTTETRTLTQLSVVQAPAFGGPLRLSVPDSNPDDRLLDIIAVDDIPPARLLPAAARVLLRSPRSMPGISVRHATRVRVRADGPLEVTLDGEIAGVLPGAFEVAGEALRVITPLGFVDIDDDAADGSGQATGVSGT